MYDAIDSHFIDSETISSIGQFAILWGMVEEEYFEKCCNTTKLKNMVVSNNTDDLASYARAIKEALMALYRDPNDIEERLCMRGNDYKSFAERVNRFLKCQRTTEKESVYAAVCICFRIRNNLFHGEKAFWLLYQQKPIIDACSDFLNELMVVDGALSSKSD